MPQIPIDLVRVIAEFSESRETKILAEVFRISEFTYINRKVHFPLVKKPIISFENELCLT